MGRAKEQPMQVDHDVPDDQKGQITTPAQQASRQEAEDMETIRVRGPQRPGDEQRLADYDARRSGELARAEQRDQAEAEERARHEAAQAQAALDAQAQAAEAEARAKADEAAAHEQLPAAEQGA